MEGPISAQECSIATLTSAPWDRIRATPKAFVATFVITMIWLAVDHARDFHIYWPADAALRTGGWTAVCQITNLTPFKYHPAFAILFAPFGLLPETVARIAWALLNGVMLLDAQRQWHDRWGLDAAAIGMGYLCIGHVLFWQYHFGNVNDRPRLHAARRRLARTHRVRPRPACHGISTLARHLRGSAPRPQLPQERHSVVVRFPLSSCRCARVVTSPPPGS